MQGCHVHEEVLDGIHDELQERQAQPGFYHGPYSKGRRVVHSFRIFVEGRALEENKDWPGLHGHNEEDEGHPSYLATDGSEQMVDFPQYWFTGILSSSLDMMMDDIKEQGEKAPTSSGRPHTPAMAGKGGTHNSGLRCPR